MDPALKALLRDMEKAKNVRYWPNADIPAGAMNVRFRGQSGHSLPPFPALPVC